MQKRGFECKHNRMLVLQKKLLAYCNHLPNNPCLWALHGLLGGTSEIKFLQSNQPCHNWEVQVHLYIQFSLSSPFKVLGSIQRGIFSKQRVCNSSYCCFFNSLNSMLSPVPRCSPQGSDRECTILRSALMPFLKLCKVGNPLQNTHA